MPKPGIKIITEVIGTGPELTKGDWVRVVFDLQLNRGDYVYKDQVTAFKFGDRHMIAGFNYGLEGMRVGGTRQFRAGSHLCYRDLELPNVPKNAVLIFTVKEVHIDKPRSSMDPDGI